MGKLMDILRQGDAETLRAAWEQTEAADESGPLPRGEYTAHIIAGTLENSKTKETPGYKLTFLVCDGEYEGRRFFHDIWLTPAALPMAKRDLLKLGVTSLDQLEQPLPRGIRCVCRLVLRRAEDGAEYNRVQSFTVIGIDEPERDAFAPVAGSEPDADAGLTSEAAGDGDEVGETPF